MEQHSNNIVDIHYLQTGQATATDALGMREMQALAYQHRDKRFLLIKAPPASGKSRALMYIALDKLAHQGIKKVVVAVPEKSIGRSFKNTNLTNAGFFADWKVAPYFNLTDVKNEQDKKGRFKESWGWQWLFTWPPSQHPTLTQPRPAPHCHPRIQSPVMDIGHRLMFAKGEEARGGME